MTIVSEPFPTETAGLPAARPSEWLWILSPPGGVRARTVGQILGSPSDVQATATADTRPMPDQTLGTSQQ